MDRIDETIFYGQIDSEVGVSLFSGLDELTVVSADHYDPSRLQVAFILGTMIPLPYTCSVIFPISLCYTPGNLQVGFLVLRAKGLPIGILTIPYDRWVCVGSRS